MLIRLLLVLMLFTVGCGENKKDTPSYSFVEPPETGIYRTPGGTLGLVYKGHSVRFSMAGPVVHLRNN